MPSNDLDRLPLDASGAVILHPVTGWSIGPVADSFVFLAMNYLEKDNPNGKVFTVSVHPTQALQLAEDLSRHAKRIMAQKTPTKSDQS